MGCGSSFPADGSGDNSKVSDPPQKSPEEIRKEKDLQQLLASLANVPLLKRLPQDQLLQIAAAMDEATFEARHVVTRQGDPGAEFSVIHRGMARISRAEGDTGLLRGGRPATDFGEAAPGDCFGEAALLREEPCAATIVAETSLVTFKISRSKFQSLGLRGRAICLELPSAEDAPTPSDMTTRECIHQKDLVSVGLIGNGGFAHLDLVEHKPTGKTYVLKTISKGYIVKCGMQQSLMDERRVLLTVRSPFVARLYEAYNDDQYMHFLLEACLGGELYATYNRKSLHGSEAHAKYYVAGVAMAVAHLHAHNIIYRDIKPENVVLTDQGHPKLVGMGLAKVVIGKTYTLCGTPDYMAPEVIMQRGHTQAVDWWTLGILLFELLAGFPPFQSENQWQTYKMVTKGIDKVPMPPKCKGPPGDLIKALLKHDPFERLPMRRGGAEKLKGHRFFKAFDWTALENGSMEAPYKPVVESAKDLSNFVEAHKEDRPEANNYVDPGTGWDANLTISTGDGGLVRPASAAGCATVASSPEEAGG
jgi:hypothetical protein